MHRPTVDVYERHVDDYMRRTLTAAPGARAFRRKVGKGELRLDLGSGPGHMSGALGAPVIALDAAWAMVSRVESTALRVQADLEALPFRSRTLHGVWASKCLQHVPAERLPMALAGVHHAMAVGAPLEVVVFEGDGGTWQSDRPDDLPGRMFWQWPRDRLADVVAGAGFDDVVVARKPGHRVTELHVSATRARSLPDTVGPGMRLLVCGLNPAIYAADRGVGFARPGNRFWPCAIEAGLVSRPRDPRHALAAHAIGMTDLCKRATVASSELSIEEYREGAARVERLVAWLQPRAVVFVGLEGWRAAVDRRAGAGVQEEAFGGRPAYVMPSTSGLNAHSSRADLVEHLRAAAALADRS